ncbi:hypothetical protein HAX54_029698, partial [Datura stramonium]|nr:hypothetical protein [Datura stramonium]
MASSSHGNERSKMGQESSNEGVSIPLEPPRCYGLLWVIEEQQIYEVMVDYRPWYNLKDLDITKTKESEDIHGPVLSIRFKETFDDDDATVEKQARVDSDLESDDDGDDSEIGE